MPALGKEANLFSIHIHEKALGVIQLNRRLNEEKEVERGQEQFGLSEKQIHLHIEKLAKYHDLMSNSEMLKLQMETFEKNLNYAIATGMDEITFIHGIGNGVLRRELHKYLSQMEN